MANKVVRQSSKCANCVAEKSRFLKQKSNKKLVGTRSILNFYIYFYIEAIIEHADILSGV